MHSCLIKSTWRLLIGVVFLYSVSHAASIPLVNFSGEINNGVDRTAISDASVIGWSGVGQIINDNTDYGNGGWRLSFEDSEEIWQQTTHLIETGAAYSLRFDASIFAGTTPTTNFTPDLNLVGGGLLNGDFNGDVSATDSRTFTDTPKWFNIGSAGNGSQATRLNLPVDATRNAVISENGSRQFSIDTGHTLSTGERFQVSYQWRDGSSWSDTLDRVGVTLFVTDDDTTTGARTLIETMLSELSASNSSYQSELGLFAAIPASANGKRLFAFFEGVNGGGGSSGFGRVDNFVLQRGTVDTIAPPRAIVADFYVDNGGSRQVVATRTFEFKSATVNTWDHYHLAVPASVLDAHAGKLLGVQFRSNDGGIGNFQSFDNVELSYWPTASPDGSFSDNWNNTANQVWCGPGYWGNRLHDWQVNSGRVNCVLGSRDRRTLHRVGTSIRGNGADFTLSVKTGLHAGTNTATSKTGFLIGAAPNVDWRGALLVHDGLGRDFGLFLGLNGDGAVVIDDYSTGSVSKIAGGVVPAGGFPSSARLDLGAVYNDTTGQYQLTLSAYDSGNTLLSTASTNVSSDRVLGAFGLLSHKGSGNTRFWFDDFSGSGSALHTETDRHLAIVGAMYTLSRGTLKLTAQLSPMNLTSVSAVSFEKWNGASWDLLTTTPIDNTDNLSSYTARFKISSWDDSSDVDYRLGVTIDDVDYYWTGRIRKDPAANKELVIASTTCQRIVDGSIQANGMDWSPVRVWQPHVLTYTNLAKHNPDLLLATGDQIYEGQPTPEDSGTDFNRHHDYLYKWYLWVLQARDLTRDMPTICMPDDHDIYQGNLWGEGGIATNSQNTGGYEEPATWVKMVERTQTSHLPDADPYNAIQPPPTAAQGIPVYFTGMVYGHVGFAILEDRKFKTGKENPPSDPNQQFLLGVQQKEFVKSWNHDWAGQSLKCVVSQSPFGNIHTHASTGYGFSLNDKDTHGWPLHRRNETWDLLRQTRMFQMAGDQHIATVAHHGIDGPADAGYTFTAPAIANFFPRCWDPVHNSAGRTNTVSPYKGDFFFDGNGTLPDGVTPNLTASDPAHVRVIAAANPLEYYNQTRNIDPVNLHDRGAGYGIVRIDKTTRRIVFESWPIHADPDFPQTGSQFPDWPVTISQTDNDGRIPTGFLPLINTHWRMDPVIYVYDETTDNLVYSMRIAGNTMLPPVYDNTKTYRVEIAYGDDAVSEILNNQSASAAGAGAIHTFQALKPSIVSGGSTTLQWHVTAATTLSIDNGVGDVMHLSVNGVGQIELSPATSTTYTLTMNGGASQQTQVQVYPIYPTWKNTYFSPGELADILMSGDDADPDKDGFGNYLEYLFQTNPRSPSNIKLSSTVVQEGDNQFVEFELPTPVIQSELSPRVAVSTDMGNWIFVSASSISEVSRNTSPPDGTTRIRIRVNTPVPDASQKKFFRASWLLP